MQWKQRYIVENDIVQFHFYLRVCTELQVLSKTASRLWFYAYKKVQEW